MKQLLLSLIIASGALAGCQSQSIEPETNYETVTAEPGRDTETARRLNSEALALMDQDRLDQAAELLKTALAADVFFGPAHNNLGTVYFRQEKYYLAAWEFQYASKVMPKRAQPRYNLGMVLEAVGKLDEAALRYEEALELQPDDIETVASLARTYIRAGRKDEKTRKLLEEIVLNDDRPQWRTWAQEQLTLGKDFGPVPEEFVIE